MKRCLRLSLLSAMLSASTPGLMAQSWDAARDARDWAKQDKDDSFTFYDHTTRTLRTWMREGGLTGSLPVGALDDPPVRWVLDPRNNAWVAHGSQVSHIDRTSRIITKFKAPAEVGDVAWDSKGFVLSYRSPTPYLEKRDYNKGALLWSSGTKPVGGDGPAAQDRRPIVVQDSGNVLMADGRALNLIILDGETGKRLSETNFHLANGEPAPALEGPALDRGPLVLWPGKDVVLASVKASQIPATLRAGLQGVVLARLDLAHSLLEFLPTGLDESHFLVGVLESDAIFINPKGGLIQVKVK
jgi:hypothetical protein